jgi:hypothetical protein
MTVTNEMVRTAVCAQKNNKSDLVYKCVFDGNNFFVYRRVNKGVGYHGTNYKEEGWALSWYEINEVGDEICAPPMFVPVVEMAV